MSKYAETVAKAKSVLATTEAVTPVVMAAALDIVELIGTLSEKGDVDLDDVLTDDDLVANRAYLEAANVQAEIGRTIDWANVPEQSFRVASTLLGLASLFA